MNDCNSRGQGHVWEYSHHGDMRECKDCKYTEIKTFIAVPEGHKVFWE